MENQEEAGEAYAFFNCDYRNGNLLSTMKLIGERINVNGIKLKHLPKNQFPTGLSKSARKKLIFGRFPEDYKGKLFYQPDTLKNAIQLVYVIKAEANNMNNEKVARRLDERIARNLDKLLEEMSRNLRKMPRLSYRTVLYKNHNGEFVHYQDLRIHAINP